MQVGNQNLAQCESATRWVVIKWIEKTELVCNLYGVKKVDWVLPLHLTDGAFFVYRQLSEKRFAVEGIKNAFQMDFAMDSFMANEPGAYDQVSWRMRVLQKCRSLPYNLERNLNLALYSCLSWFCEGVLPYLIQDGFCDSDLSSSCNEKWEVPVVAVIQSEHISTVTPLTCNQCHNVTCYRCFGFNYYARDCALHTSSMQRIILPIW